MDCCSNLLLAGFGGSLQPGHSLEGVLSIFWGIFRQLPPLFQSLEPGHPSAAASPTQAEGSLTNAYPDRSDAIPVRMTC